MRPLLLVLFLSAATTSPVQPVDIGDRTSFLRSIHVAEHEIGEDAVCIGCSIRVDGSLRGDAVAVGGNVVVNGSVAQDAVAAAGDVRVGPGARIEGDAIAAGGYLFTDAAATIEGDSTMEMTFVHTPGQRALHWPAVLLSLAMNLTMAVVGGLVVGRPRLESFAAALRKHYLLTPTVGVATLTITITIGSTTEYLGRFEEWGDVLFLTLLFGGCVIGVIGVAFLVGSLLASDRGLVGIMATGAVAVTLALVVPVVGFFVLVLLFVYGLGMAVIGGIEGSGMLRSELG